MPTDASYLGYQANNSRYYDAYVFAQEIGDIPNMNLKTPQVTTSVIGNNNVVFHINKVDKELGYVLYRTIDGKREKLKEISTNPSDYVYMMYDYQVLPGSTVSYDLMSYDAYQNRSEAVHLDIQLPATETDGIGNYTRSLESVDNQAVSTGLPVQTLTFSDESAGFEYLGDKVITNRLTEHTLYQGWNKQPDDYAYQKHIYTDNDGYAHLRLELKEERLIGAIGMSFEQDRDVSIRIPKSVHYEVDGKEYATSEQPSIRQLDFTQPLGGENTHKKGEYWFWGFNDSEISGKTIDIKLELEYNDFLYMRELLVLDGKSD
ncbi:hypothetical protein [Listeria aquatica]|uniref:hypothetical protein n=1 Tax=Listeria aquatica TaxID=1494960 RepID=UPI0031F54077